MAFTLLVAAALAQAKVSLECGAELGARDYEPCVVGVVAAERELLDVEVRGVGRGEVPARAMSGGTVVAWRRIAKGQARAARFFGEARPPREGNVGRPYRFTVSYRVPGESAPRTEVLTLAARPPSGGGER